MTERAPLVSVVMPVHNAERFVGDAIRSMLGQTFRDFEFIVVNDGSTDGSQEIITSFHDFRIRLINQANQGIGAALNNGIAAARGELIARMDADDLSLPERLAKQTAFLQSNPHIGILGTWATIEDIAGMSKGSLEHPTDDARIRYALLFDTPFVHPTVMFRRCVFVEDAGYSSAPGVFEDFELWSRMIRRTQGANLPEHLLRYRLVPGSFSHQVTTRHERLFEQRLTALRRAFPLIDDALLNAVAELGLRHAAISLGMLRRVHRHLDQHIRATITDLLAAREVRRQMLHALIGYRLIPHRSLLHRAADRVLKELVVLLLRSRILH
ncbi:MAG: glycosyltransferase [Flavobacteriales bacterium]|nr:glycosyltransferase [Flavobacteriales bacterium]